MDQPDQLGLEGMPQRLFSCTPTRLNTWLDCPRRYRMTYLDRPAPPKGAPWAHNSLGASLHNALAAWWSLPRERRTPAAAGELLAAGWLTDGYRDDAQSQHWLRRATDMVVGYASTLDPDDEPRGVERTVATRTARLAVSGRVDRIDERDDELVVVDYKSGRRPPTTDDVRGSLALALYALAVRQTLRADCHRVELHHLPSGEVVGWDHTEESLARHLGRAESIGGEAAAADARFREGLTADERDEVFPPRPSALCGWCDYARHCEQGRAVSEIKESWAALDAAGPVEVWQD